MKYLLLIAIVGLLIWLARSGRRVNPPDRPKQAPPADAKLQDVVACAQCGEALPGRGGVFCGEAHRREYENTHGGP